MTQTVPLFFPIEIQNRELDFRLFLAGLCAKPGRRIFIGQHDAIYRLARRTDGGVYAGKNLFRSVFPGCELDRQETIKKNGIAVVYLHEEGLPFEREPAARDRFLSVLVDPVCLAEDDILCAWGDYQREYYLSRSPYGPAKVITTGHPRFDLCTPAYRDYYAPAIKELRERFGDYILINTNFAYWVSLPHIQDAFCPQMGYKTDKCDERISFVETWGQMSHTLIDMVRLATQVSARFPQLNIIVRPHPVECLKYYQTVFKDVRNVHVAHEGSVMPWLLAAKALVHNGCTTAIEAALAGIPVVKLETVHEGCIDYFYTNLIGHPCSTVGEAVEAIGGIVDGGGSCPPDLSAMPNFELAASLLNNYRQPAYPLLVDVIEDTVQRYHGRHINCDIEGFTREFNSRQNLLRAKRVLRTVSPVKKQHYHKSLSHSPQSPKFPDLQRPKIAEKMEGVQRVLKKELRWQILNSQLISVEAG